jgi:hypothetical protein
MASKIPPKAAKRSPFSSRKGGNETRIEPKCIFSNRKGPFETNGIKLLYEPKTSLLGQFD